MFYAKRFYQCLVLIFMGELCQKILLGMLRVEELFEPSWGILTLIRHLLLGKILLPTLTVVFWAGILGALCFKRKGLDGYILIGLFVGVETLYSICLHRPAFDIYTMSVLAGALIMSLVSIFTYNKIVAKKVPSNE